MRVYRILFLLICVLLAIGSACGSAHAQPSQTLSPLTDTTSGWHVVFSNPQYGMNSHSIDGLCFPSRDTGYASAWNGTQGILLRSTNAGQTWDSISTPIPSGRPLFVTSLIGYSCGGPTSGTVWKTVDGGNSWIQQNRNSIASGPIAFGNEHTGVVFGVGQEAITTDGGQTWREVFPPIGANVYAGCFTSSNTVYGVGQIVNYPPQPDYPEAGLCLKSTDGGATWKQIYTGVAHEFYSSYALDSSTLFVGSLTSCIARTTDGGQTWDSARVIGGFNALSFVDHAHGLAVGVDNQNHSYYGVAYATSDSGKTWTKQLLPDAPPLLGVHMFNDTEAVVCGGGNIYRTTTGGLFSSVRQQSRIDLHLHVFPNPSSGLVSIEYQLPTASTVSFVFTDCRGVKVGAIGPTYQYVGSHSQMFDASTFAAGVYYFIMTTSEGSCAGSFVVRK